MSSDTVEGTYNNGKVKFQYAETKSGNQGGGPRGIKIMADGSPKGFVNFSINPNPHDNPDYNKKQSDFYADAAKKLASDIKQAKEKAKFTPLKPGERVPTVKGPDWTKMKKPAQDTAIKKYNEDEQKKELAKIDKEYYDEIQKDLIAASNSKFTFGGVTYTLKKS